MGTNLIHRKESLVITAIAIINEKGFQGLSTREVAKREGVSEATIFKHYQSKNELLIAVLDHSSQYDEAMTQSTFAKDLSPIEKLIHLIDSYMVYYENYPEITAVLLSYTVLIHEEELKEKVIDIIYKRMEAIKYLMNRSVENKELNPSVDSEILADIILGMIQQNIIKWRMTEFSFSLREYTLTSLRMLLDSFSNT